MAVPSFVQLDPAIERWNLMREDAYKHFRFTRRTTFVALTGCLFVPAAIYYLASQTHYTFKWTGKRKGESLVQS
ncbi:hypothetical protein SCLCIDRAFT_22902 [Scleroderma citrinum Foug A]|uniref:NADH dehydrogenase [ubiquinone] 1 beta subcomplex subunit 4 n=1 Tax=Scleroderma citrinum Foug A TaxID=1036808 RepID=A0A0C3EAY1_9AGAM|nr:hypothetical protein SCLCIDRAFT_22902 [Scleroderma citrinum Foug A]